MCLELSQQVEQSLFTALPAAMEEQLGSELPQSKFIQ